MTAASIRACAVIPSHNHWQAMPAIVERLRALGLAVFVIDDGSEPPARRRSPHSTRRSKACG